MTQLALVFAVGFSLVSFLTSITVLAIQYARRHENPITAPLEQAIHALQLGQADIIDRVDHWTRRDRTRRMRAEKLDDQVEDIPQPIAPQDLKAQLRQRAQQLGVIK
jgi:hypothetical protein